VISVSRPKPFSRTGSWRNSGAGISFRQLCRSLIQVLNSAFAVKVFTRLPMTNQNECAVEAPKVRTPYTTCASPRWTGENRFSRSSGRYSRSASKTTR
jgi:hypothetical protein